MMFSPGDKVHVRYDWPESRGQVHIRSPHYIRGKTGHIVRHLGNFPNPEDLAFARPAPLRELYHVAFPLNDIWPGENRDTDTVVVEVYEHWLERR